MKSSKWIKSLVLFLAAGTLAAPKPPEHHSAKPPHHFPLAEHLCRSEAHVRAIEHHLSLAAQRVAVRQVVNVKLVDRARKLVVVHRGVRRPLLWREYIGRVPIAIITEEKHYHTDVIEVEAEKAAVALGDNFEALWARHKQVQAERLVL